jgi:ABC-type uncharacterized transport system involved in gliding motility auxiliary subunit
MALNPRSWTWAMGGVGGMGLVAFGAVAYRTGRSGLDTTWTGIGAVSFALVVSWLWLDRATVGRWLRSRAAQRSGIALALTLVMLGVAVAANVLAYRHDRRWDLTSTNRYSLSAQTISVLNGLDTEVAITAFFVGESQDRALLEDLISGYEQHTDRLTVEFHDPVLSPRLAKQFEIESALGTVVLHAGVATQRMEAAFDEEALTNALIRVTAGREHTICTMTGHGELDPDDDQSPASISGVVTKLERINYTFESVNLMRERGVPDRCAALVAADPRIDWLAPEREMVAQYLASGGQVVLLLDPEHSPLLAEDLARYGIVVGRDIVLESNPKYQLVGGDASYLLLDGQGFADHPITAPIRGMVMMRVARSIGRGEAVPGIEVQELMHTSEYAWAETRLDGRTAPTPDVGVDRIGKVPVALIAEVKDPSAITVGSTSLDGAPAEPATTSAGGRLVVFGDSDFTSNELLDQASNMDVLQNTLAWVVGEGDQVSIRPNIAARGSLTLDSLSALIMWLLSVFVVPCLAIGGAIATYLSRRRR